EGYRGDGGKDPASEPGANGYIVFDNGVRGTYIGMKGAVPDVSVTVYGSKGQIVINSTGEYMVLQTEHGLVTRPLQVNALGVRSEYQHSGIAGAVGDLIHAIETGAPTLSPPEEAQKSVAILHAMLRSHFEGGRRV